MLRDAFTVFDDLIFRGTFYSDDAFNIRLGAWDQLYVQMSVFNPIFAGTPAIQLALEHSGDANERFDGAGGVNWEQKALDLNGTKFTLATWHSGNSVWGFDWGTVPKLRFARIAISASSTGTGSSFTSARVRVHAALRDAGGGQPYGLHQRRS